MTPTFEQEDRLIVEELRRSLSDVVAAYRFGSSAHGTTHPGSDIDIAVLSATRLAADARFDLQERIASTLGRNIDLVDLRAASSVLAMQVVAHGVLLFEVDAKARGIFEDRVFGAYARLNEERRGILQRVAAEGTVHGR